MRTTYRNLFVLSIALLILTACSSEPPDNFLLSDFAGYSDDITNARILRKGKCGSISSTALAKGVEEAWLVTFDYDSELVPHNESYLVVLYVKADGDWLNGWVNFGFQLDACP